MRALVKRLAGSGLTVLLSSHDMDEVEEICDNVTIMKRGIGRLPRHHRRAAPMAPDPGHLLGTSDDARALVVAHDDHPGVTVAPRLTADSSAAGPTRAVSAYVADLVRADIDLLAFTPTQTPLEALFFMLTDAHPEAATVRRAGATETAEAGASR